MWILGCIHSFGLCELDIKVLINRMQLSGDSEVVLQFYSHFLANQGLEIREEQHPDALCWAAKLLKHTQQTRKNKRTLGGPAVRFQYTSARA